MIVTLTGAYKNVGDHLIGFRARQLLAKYVDDQIVNIDRKNISDEHYAVFNKAKAVFLCGGPAYQPAIFPKIYSIDLARIQVPVIPYGLGYKNTLNKEKFSFTPSGLSFVKEVHSKITTSSARDIKTVDALNDHGVHNVTMTGCPAWYDLDFIDKDFIAAENVRTLAFSGPAKVDEIFFEALKKIQQKFPQAKKYITFHHGLITGYERKQLSQSWGNLKASFAGLLNNFETISLQSDLEKMFRFYDSCDLHIGYRVHAHLYRLSKRKPSILLCEDTRGLSQSITLKQSPILMNSKNALQDMEIAMDTYKDRSQLSITQEVLSETFPVMRKFLMECC